MSKKPPQEIPDFMLDRKERLLFNEGKVELVSPDKAEMVDVVVSMRVINAPFKAIGSVEEPCTECGELCYRSPSSPKMVRLMCMQCALPMMEKEAMKQKLQQWNPGTQAKN